MQGEDVSAWSNLVELLFRELGVRGTIATGTIIFLGLIGWRLYTDWREGWYLREYKRDKEATIQRLASQDRAWRVYYCMRDLSLSRGQAERLIHENEFTDPKQARDSLEKQRRSGKGGKKKR